MTSSRQQENFLQKGFQVTELSATAEPLEEYRHSPTDRFGGLKVVKGLIKMKKRYYIAYGSNLNVRQMKIRCPKAKLEGTATLENHILYFRGSLTGSYLTIEPKIGASVPVAVWEVTPSDEKALDRYEGYPNFYYKQDYTLKVTSMDKTKETTLDCFAYVMRSDRPIGIPSDYYVYTCLEGYEYFGFNKKILLNTVDRMRRILCRRMK